MTNQQIQTLTAYTDGACKGNPGIGGWGVYLTLADGSTHELYAGEANTTNNRMELMAAIQALTFAPSILSNRLSNNADNSNHAGNVSATTAAAMAFMLHIWTDSTYVKKGITEWIHKWKKNNWKTASKKPVANQDLWQQLDALTQQYQPEWHWVKGHAGDMGNEKADELANKGVQHPQGNLAQFKLNTLDTAHSESTDDSIAVKKNTSISHPKQFITP